jgi:hypothetical protein
MLHRVFAFERGDNDGAARHERAKLIEERALPVDGVKSFGRGASESGLFQSHDTEALLEEALKNGSLHALFDGVRFHDTEGAFFRHFEDSRRSIGSGHANSCPGRYLQGPFRV